MRLLFLLFVVVPLGELYLLILLSRQVGIGTTFAITLITGIVGSFLAKREGLRAWREWRNSLAVMQTPEVGLVEGFLILIGGALLITPGVLTDVTGLAFLLPWTRKPLARFVKRRVQHYLEQHTVVLQPMTPEGARRHQAHSADGVIEGSGEALDDNARANHSHPRELND